MTSGDDPLANRREEEEIQASDHVDGEAERTDPLDFINGCGKDALRSAVQEEAEPADKESDSKGKGRRQSGKSSPGKSGPPERRVGLGPGVKMYRRPADSRPRIMHVKRGETTEGSHNRSTSPRWRQAAYRPHGKATKRHSAQADPVAAPEEEIGSGGPSSSGEKETSQAKTPSSPKTRTCPTCGKACHSLKTLNKH